MAMGMPLLASVPKKFHKTNCQNTCKLFTLQCNNRQEETHAGTKAVGGRFDQSVITLHHEERSTEDGAVHSDQGEENTQAVVQRGKEPVQQHFHQLHRGSNHRDETEEVEEVEVHALDDRAVLQQQVEDDVVKEINVLDPKKSAMPDMTWFILF